MSKHIKTGQNMSKPVKIGGLLCVSKVAEAPFLYHAVKQLARPKTRSSSSPQMALIAARGTEGLPLSKCQRTRMIGKLRSQRKPMSRRLKRLELNPGDFQLSPGSEQATGSESSLLPVEAQTLGASVPSSSPIASQSEAAEGWLYVEIIWEG